MTGGLRIDDLLYLVTPFPLVNQNFASITGILAFRNDNDKILPRDASDVALGPPVLVDLEPALSFAREGGASGPSFPDALTVRLSRPVAADTVVTLMSSDPGLGVMDVTVPMGSSTAVVPVTPVTASTTAYTVTGMLDGRMAMADVRVIGTAEAPSTVTITPATQTVVPGGTATYTVALDIPAPSTGADVSLMVDAGGTVPMTVTVPADTLSADFDFTADATTGTSTITATLGTAMDTAQAVVSNLAGTGLSINEIDYDQPGADSAEFVEIYNAGSASVDLTGLAVVLVNGSTTPAPEYGRATLSGTLAAGGFLVVGIPGQTLTLPAGVTRVDFSGTTGIQNGPPDGVALVDTVGLRVVDALSYEGAITMASIMGFSAPVNLVEGTAATAVDSGAGSLVRLPDGHDTDNADADWSLSATPTPGAPNM